MRAGIVAPRPNVAFAVLCAVLAVFFGYAVAVQTNDPDPVVWMGMYGAAALVSAVSVRIVLPPWIPGLVALVAAIWALVLLPSVVRQLPSFLDTFGTIEMMAPGVEETREALGLTIVARWTAAVGLVSRRRRARTPS
jgi:hypothetical protein